MTEVKVTVWFGWKPGYNIINNAIIEFFLNNLFDKIGRIVIYKFTLLKLNTLQMYQIHKLI